MNRLHCGHTFCKYCLWECFTRHVPDPNEAVQGSDQEEYATADEGQEEGSATPRPTTQHPEAAETQEGGQEATLQLKAQRRHNLFCPSCRFRLYERPLPAFGLRDMIQSTSNHLNALNGSFTNTALQACVPSGERCKAPAMDDTWNGLFPQSRGRRHRGLKDEADNVVRCLHCNWEIYEATCESW